MKASEKGFTLIELVIVIGIVGILVAIAIPSYESSVVKSNRKAAAGCMLEASQFMERFYTTNLRYDQDLAGAAVSMPALSCRTDLTSSYTIAFQATPTTTAYTVQATPLGRQLAKDPGCLIMRIDQTGAKSVTGSLLATPNDCFAK
jgi:type IV pilus assembly protein PilE